jgi:hypothetical protein
MRSLARGRGRHRQRESAARRMPLRRILPRRAHRPGGSPGAQEGRRPRTPPAGSRRTQQARKDLIVGGTGPDTYLERSVVTRAAPEIQGIPERACRSVRRHRGNGELQAGHGHGPVPDQRRPKKAGTCVRGGQDIPAGEFSERHGPLAVRRRPSSPVRSLRWPTRVRGCIRGRGSAGQPSASLRPAPGVQCRASQVRDS